MKAIATITGLGSLTSALLLATMGDVGSAVSLDTTVRPADAARQADAMQPAGTVRQADPVQPTLLDDEGRANAVDPSTWPVAEARTHAARYASAGQAAALWAAVGSHALSITVDCCNDGERDVDAAVAAGAASLAAEPGAAALLVGGDDLERAAAAADRLEPLLAGRVWLVTTP